MYKNLNAKSGGGREGASDPVAGGRQGGSVPLGNRVELTLGIFCFDRLRIGWP